METTEKKRFVRLKKTGEVVEVHWFLRDGDIAYVTNYGIKIAKRDEYKEIE